MTKKKKILVDGANVAYTGVNGPDKPRVDTLINMKRLLESRGYDPIIIVDASLRYEVDEPEKMEAMIDEGKIEQAPAETDADYFVVELAKEYDAKIVTNDQYEDLVDRDFMQKHRVAFMVVDGHIELRGLEEEGKQDK